MSRIVVIGGTGTIGSAVAETLEPDHDVFRVGHSSGPYQVNITSKDSIDSLLSSLSTYDHLISAAGDARFAPLDELSDDDFDYTLGHKLMGQINLVRVGRAYIADGGSFTLTTGILANNPVPGSAAVSTVNAGLEGFVRAADLELERELRVNAVSPDWVAETLEEMDRDPSDGVPADRVAETYADLVDSDRSGDVVSVS